MLRDLPLTYSVLGMSVFARQLCLPVPALLLLITAGVMARESRLSVSAVLLVSVVGCLAGDLVWFEIGRHWGRGILKFFTSLSDDPGRTAGRSRKLFARHGAYLLVVAKFVPGLDGILPPLAGMEGAGRIAFIAFDSAGAFLWSGFYIALGMCFANQVDPALALVKISGQLVILCVGMPVALFIAWRLIEVIRMLRRLKMKRISAALLQTRLETEGDSIVLIDLLNFQTEIAPESGIPGAIRIDPRHLRNRSTIVARPGMCFVIYCSTSGQFRSARVAMAMQRRGITDVWVLEDGLTGWRYAGLPVSDQLLNEEQAVERFGLHIVQHRTRRSTTEPRDS